MSKECEETVTKSSSLKSTNTKEYNIYVDNFDYLTVENGMAEEIKIYSINGSLIKEGYMNDIYVGDLNSGQYIAVLIIEGEKYEYKFVK